MRRAIAAVATLLVVLIAAIGTVGAYRSDARAATVPTYRVTAVAAQFQQTSAWCVPASAVVSLSQMGERFTQAQLAQQLVMTRAGVTDVSRAMATLDGLAEQRGFTYRLRPDATVDVGRLAKVLIYDLGSLHQLPLLDVWMARLPWDVAMRAGQAGHLIVATGYDPAAGTVTVWDPWRPTGGSHVIAVAVLFAALRPAVGVIAVEVS